MLDKIKTTAKDFLIIVSSNMLSMVGAIIATTSTIVFFIFLGVSLFNLNNYIGILGFLIIPAFFVLGLILIPLGFFFYRGKVGFKDLKDVTPSKLMERLKISKPQGLLTAVFFITVFNVVILATAGYEAFHYMESNVFCGTLCHTVMIPEYTAYQDSPHSRVACVTCHIGAGADWFVKSKLSGTRQIFAVTFNTYHKPIKTPIRDLRPARETCEQCHWPEKFTGQKLKNIIRFAEDEKNSPAQTVLLLNVGSAMPGDESGIHKHVGRDFNVRYISENDERENILWVRFDSKDGTKKIWAKEGFKPSLKEIENARVMDCIDCHNRATHTYDDLSHALDRGLQFGKISAALPFIKREAVRLLKVDYPDRKKGESSIREELAGFYRKNYPSVIAEKKDALDISTDEIVRIYLRNIHPEMKVTWGVYPNHLGHEESPGCFRCHNYELTAGDGSNITQDCSNCHSIISTGEPPKEIKDLLTSAQGK